MKSKGKGEFMNKIILDIKSTIKQIDGEVNTIDMMTEGELFEKNNSIYLIYHESEVSGMEGSKTMLKISGDTVTMTRFGTTTSKIIFNEMNPMESVYQTPYGNFNMTVKTSTLSTEFDMDKLSGFIKVDYEMTLESLSNSINHLEIKIKS